MANNPQFEDLLVLYSEQSESESITLKSFCETMGVSYSSFIRYRRKRLHEASPGADLVPVDFVDAPHPPSPVPSAPCGAVEGLTLSFGGVSLAASSIDASSLICLVRELKGGAPC